MSMSRPPRNQDASFRRLVQNEEDLEAVVYQVSEGQFQPRVISKRTDLSKRSYANLSKMQVHFNEQFAPEIEELREERRVLGSKLFFSGVIKQTFAEGCSWNGIGFILLVVLPIMVTEGFAEWTSVVKQIWKKIRSFVCGNKGDR
ncbi:uncharacterized protein LOC115921112 isoform X2 [Strongylocentrotus purpuratus]|nr:uncharacterized protein LOC115921112 isoform X2 [Strongylocentrotus purpuratus]